MQYFAFSIELNSQPPLTPLTAKPGSHLIAKSWHFPDVRTSRVHLRRFQMYHLSETMNFELQLILHWSNRYSLRPYLFTKITQSPAKQEHRSLPHEAVVLQIHIVVVVGVDVVTDVIIWRVYGKISISRIRSPEHRKLTGPGPSQLTTVIESQPPQSTDDVLVTMLS